MTMLGHVKVVDLTRDLGGYAGALLARLGAAVAWTGAAEGLDPGEVEMIAHGKRLVGEDEAIALLGHADIAVRGPGPLPPAIDATLMARHGHGLIAIEIVPFDPEGPNADRPASDLTLMARSGLMTIIGDPDRPPLTLPGRQAWALAGIQGAIAALVALQTRRQDPAGERASVSAYQSAVLANYREPTTWQWAGRVGTRTGNLLVRGKSGVEQVWACADGWVTWALVDNPAMMRATVAQLAADGMAGELADIDWGAILVADMPRETLKRWEAIVAAWVATKTKAEVTRLSNASGMGMSAIADLDDVFVSDHLAARGLWEEAEVAGATVKVPGPLFREVAP